MSILYYFAYGSNMSSKRLTQRVPSASFVSTATLFEHDLRFHKKSHDGSAKCNAFETSNPDDHVIGTVFTLQAIEKPALDSAEGLGFGYEVKQVEVQLRSGQWQSVFTYYATDIDEMLLPYEWYHTHVINGAREYNLPNDYLTKIEKIKSISDPDHHRHQKELSIYESFN